MRIVVLQPFAPPVLPPYNHWYRLGTLQIATLTKGQCPGWVGCLTGTQAQVGLRGLPFFCADVRFGHNTTCCSAVTTR